LFTILLRRHLLRGLDEQLALVRIQRRQPNIRRTADELRAQLAKAEKALRELGEAALDV
jgi:hypothetical protein